MTLLFGPTKSLRRAIWLVLAIGLFAFCFAAIPSLFDRGHVIDDIVHGSAFQVALMCILPLLLAMLGIDFALRNPNSRLTGRVAVYPYSLMFIWSFILPLIVPAVYDHMKASDLSKRGVPMQAHLVRELDRECGKGGCTVGLEYTFIPSNAGKTFRGYTRESSSNRDSNSVYAYAIDTRTVPILYDPRDPTQSMVNFRGGIPRQATPGYMFGLLGIFGGIATAVWAFFVVILEIALWQQRKKVAANAPPTATRI